MYVLKRCGRLIHHAPTHDETPVCLMHSHDPEKSDEEFQVEFEAILQRAGNGVADFTGFVFPSAKYTKREFTPVCLFVGATFIQNADFSIAMFTQNAHFLDATFTQNADFNIATFTRNAHFREAKFTQNANFVVATFTQDADFRIARFTQDADFSIATFTQNADFSIARFTQDADFSIARFTQNADFREAKFTQDADFNEATFTQNAYFNGATLTQSADFREAKFLGAAVFSEAIFRGDKPLKEKKQEEKLLPGPIFCLAEFLQPEKVRFYRTYLGQALFHNCDVSKVNFSSVTWRERKGSGKSMVLEEEKEFDLKAAADLRPEAGSPDERHYRLIEELYQRLKKNYDEHTDYRTAGDFHYGEMEMKRLATRPPGKSIAFLLGSLGEARMNRVRSWWHRRLSLVAWYKYASQYGESYARPLPWLLLVLVVFAGLYPLAGLELNKDAAQRATATAPTQAVATATDLKLSYGHFGEFVKNYPGRKWVGRCAFFGHSLMTTLSVAGFQKELKYEPSYPWGRALALLELLLTSTLAALFFLAVRRQFRR